MMTMKKKCCVDAGLPNLGIEKHFKRWISKTDAIKGCRFDEKSKQTVRKLFLKSHIIVCVHWYGFCYL